MRLPRSQEPRWMEEPRSPGAPEPGAQVDGGAPEPRSQVDGGAQEPGAQEPGARNQEPRSPGGWRSPGAQEPGAQLPRSPRTRSPGAQEPGSWRSPGARQMEELLWGGLLACGLCPRVPRNYPDAGQDKPAAACGPGGRTRGLPDLVLG